MLRPRRASPASSSLRSAAGTGTPGGGTGLISAACTAARIRNAGSNGFMEKTIIGGKNRISDFGFRISVESARCRMTLLEPADPKPRQPPPYSLDDEIDLLSRQFRIDRQG